MGFLDEFPDGVVVQIDTCTKKLSAVHDSNLKIETDPLFERILFAIDRFIESLEVV